MGRMWVAWSLIAWIWSAVMLPSSAYAQDLAPQLEQFEIPALSPSSDPVPIWVVRIPVTALAQGRLRPFWGDTLVGTAELTQVANQQGALAAINGGFFNRNTRQPIGALRRDGVWISNPILGRGVMAWDDQGRVQFGRIQFAATLSTQIGDRIPVVGLNTAYILPGLSQITPDWGSSYTTQTDDEWVISVGSDQVIGIQTAGPAGSLTVRIPVNGYLLAGRQLEGQLQAQKLLVGDQLSLTIEVDPPELGLLPHLIGAGPLLIQDGVMVLDPVLEQFQPSFITQRAARSAVGLSRDGSLLWVVAGQAQESTGLTLTELATLMQQLGSIQALNLDGGNSSTLVWQGQGINLPGSNAEGRIPWQPRVHNGLGLFP